MKIDTDDPKILLENGFCDMIRQVVSIEEK